MCGACATHCIGRTLYVPSFVRYLQAAAATAAGHGDGPRPPATAVTLVFLWRCEIPEGRVRFVLLRPPRCQTKSHFICRGWHDNYTCTTTSSASAPVSLSNRPLRGDLHSTAALQEWELGGGWAR